MADVSPPSPESVRAGHEVRDVRVPLVLGSAATLVLAGMLLLIALGQVSHLIVPEQDGKSPPTVMPGEVPVNDRVRAIPSPRLGPLEPLEAEPPFRSSRPVPDRASPDQRPEDLRAGRQPGLQGYAWVEKGKVARIPIDRAMDAVVESEKSRGGPKGDRK